MPIYLVIAPKRMVAHLAHALEFILSPGDSPSGWLWFSVYPIQNPSSARIYTHRSSTMTKLQTLNGLTCCPREYSPRSCLRSARLTTLRPP